MKYQIIGKNISVTEGISAAIKKKLARMDKYFLINEDVECRVVVSTHTNAQKVEITIFLPQMKLRAEVSDVDLYAAIDLAIDKLQGQMRKVKTRMDRSNGKISLGHSLDLQQIESDETLENDVVVKTKNIYLEPMSLDEAITQMDALGHDFFLYLDKEEDKISVVYKRKNKGYGLIEADNPIK